VATRATTKLAALFRGTLPRLRIRAFTGLVRQGYLGDARSDASGKDSEGRRGAVVPGGWRTSVQPDRHARHRVDSSDALAKAGIPVRQVAGGGPSTPRLSRAGDGRVNPLQAWLFILHLGSKKASLTFEVDLANSHHTKYHNRAQSLFDEGTAAPTPRPPLAAPRRKQGDF